MSWFSEHSMRRVDKNSVPFDFVKDIINDVQIPHDSILFEILLAGYNFYFMSKMLSAFLCDNISWCMQWLKAIL